MVRPGPDVLPPRVAAIANGGGRIGLLGGSFNPAHEAHRHISLIALRRLKLDAVWWLVSPQNPLKSEMGMAPLAKRLEHAREVAAHPDIFASAIETALGTRFTVDTIAALKRNFPRARLVWLMGGDNLATFHTWQRWKDIARMVPIAVIARPGFTIRALGSPAGQHLRGARIPASDASKLANEKPPAWVFVRERLDPTSATDLRKRGLWR